MNQSKRSILKIIFPLFLGCLLVYYSFFKISFSELSDYFINANYFWIFLGTALGFLSHLSRAYRWKFLVEPFGLKFRIWNSVMAVFSGYLVNYTVPRAGEVSRATILANYDGIPFEKGLGTIVAERIVDVVVMICIILFMLVWKPELLIITFEELNSVALRVQTDEDPSSALIFILVTSLFVLVALFIVFKFGFSLLLFKIKKVITGVGQGVLSIFKLKQKWFFILHTLFIWLMYVLMFYVTTFSIDSISGLDFSIVLIGFIAASFSVALTNGGLGAYPLAVAISFSVFGVNEASGLAFGWIMWASQTVMIIFFGGISLIFLPIYNRIHSKKLN